MSEGLSDRIPRCPECDRQMSPAPYGWWECPVHPWRMMPDRNLPDRERLYGKRD